MAERDAIRARMKPSRWGSHTAAHASVTIILINSNFYLHYDF